MNNTRMNFGFVPIVIVALILFGGKISDFMTKVGNTFICESRQNYGKAFPVYNGPSHRYTGRLDRKVEDLVFFKPKFEKAE